jgi:hypothetical protein
MAKVKIKMPFLSCTLILHFFINENNKMDKLRRKRTKKEEREHKEKKKGFFFYYHHHVIFSFSFYNPELFPLFLSITQKILPFFIC